MTQAWDLPLPATKKLLLLAMCDWANDAGVCFPSMASISRRVSVSGRQCQRLMGELLSQGLVAVTANPNGGVSTRRYQINIDALRRTETDPGGDKLTPVTQVSPLPLTVTTSTRDVGVTRTVKTRHSHPPQQLEAPPLDWTYLPMFGEPEREVVVRLMKGIDPAEGQALLDELAGALRAGAIKTQWPAWLQGLARRARAGAFIPHHALTVQRDRQRVAREVTEATARKLQAERRNDPQVREKSFDAMAAAAAALGRPLRAR